LKPVDPDEFGEALQKAIDNKNLRLTTEQLEGLSIANTEKKFDQITLATSTGLVFTQTNDITHIESYGNYTFAHCAISGRHFVSKNLKEFEEMLPQPPFFRTHQSHIVNIEFVSQISTSGSDVAVMKS